MGKYGFIPAEVAEQIAIALSHKTGVSVRTDQVEVEPLPLAGQYLITVHESAALVQQVIPYVDDPTPVSLNDLCTIGYRTNRKPYLMNPYQHGMMVGATESGKSSLIHVLLGHVTRCPQVVVWIGGVWKLYDFVAGWLERYLDTGILPPIDWVANGHQDVREMMAACLRIADWRTRQPMNLRSQFPTIIAIFDELTYIFDEKFLSVDVNGIEMKADKMLAGIARGTAGAGIYEWLATQRDTYENCGDEGGTVTAQMQFVAVFPIRDQGTVGRLLGAYSLPTPSRRGECWLDPGLIDTFGGDHHVKLRIPYIQTIDSRKKVLHNGPNTSDVSWNRRYITHEMDHGSAIAAGPEYNNRHRFVTAEMLEYVRSARPVTVPANKVAIGIGGSSGIMAGISMADIENAIMEVDSQIATKRNGTNGQMTEVIEPIEGLDAILSNVNLSVPNVDTNGTVNLSQYRNRPDMVKAILRASNKPLARADIIEQLKVGGHTVTNPQTVTTILGNLITTGSDGSTAKFGRTEDNRYYAL